MEEDLEKIANEMAESLVELERENYQPGIESYEAYAARKKEEILQELYEENELFSEGYEYILEKVQGDSHLKVEDFMFTEEQLAVFDDQDKMEAADEEEIPYQVLLGIPDERMQIMYKIAVDYFQEEKYQESAAVFTFLVRTNQYVPPVWIGLGSAYRAMGNNQKALDAYYEAIILDPFSLESYAYAAACLVDMGNIVDARQLFLDAQKMIEEIETVDKEIDTKELKAGIEKYLEELDKMS